MNPPDAATRMAAARVLSMRSARDLARLVVSSAREGRLLLPDDVVVVLTRLGIPVHVAAVCAQAIMARAAATILLDNIEQQGARAASVTPVASFTIGRLRLVK